MAKQKWKGGALIAPVPPAMISCGSEEDGSSNIITVAWTGIINTIPQRPIYRCAHRATRISSYVSVASSR